MVETKKMREIGQRMKSTCVKWKKNKIVKITPQIELQISKSCILLIFFSPFPQIGIWTYSEDWVTLKASPNPASFEYKLGTLAIFIKILLLFCRFLKKNVFSCLRSVNTEKIKRAINKNISNCAPNCNPRN